MSSQTGESMPASSNSGVSLPSNQQPARASRLSRRTMAADIDMHPPSDPEETDTQQAQQAPAASSGRATRLSARSVANSEMPSDANPSAEGDPDLASAAAEMTDGVPQTDAETAPEAVAEAEAEEDPIPEAPTIPVEVPVQVELIRQTDRPPVVAPSDAIGDALAAYNILRAFSWQIRLSPFAFEELCAALFLPTPSPLMDELHVCLIRSLAFDENKAERAERTLDLSLLDAVSWPEFVWEYLYMRHDDLRHNRWTQRSQDTPANISSDAVEPSPAKASSKPDLEAAFKENLSDQGNKTSIAVTGRSPIKRKMAPANGAILNQPSLANGHSAQQRLASTGNGMAHRREHEGEEYEGAVMLRNMMKRKPFKSKTQVEYYGLPPDVKAAILVSLVNDLLDISSVRHEIDKREAAGQWVAGKGGAGGSFPMRSEEERAKRAEAGSDAEGKDEDYKDEDDEDGPSQAEPVVFEGDGNTDLCVLCGVGGSLLCCDGCPAAYHMRCIGETAKSIPEGEWLCPECAVGGRGDLFCIPYMPEANICADIRNVLRKETIRLTTHSLSGLAPLCMSRSARPETSDIGGEAREEGPAPMDRWAGEMAAAEAKAVRKIRGEEKPHPTSIQAIREPPEVQLAPGLSAEGYVNRYRNSWTAAVAATKTFVDDMSRRRGRPPAGAPRVSISVAELPVPVPLSRFQWPSSAGKGQRGNLVRCGQCHMCRNPLMKKPCLHPIVPRGLDGSDEGTSAPKLMTLANYAMKLEREVWGALDGPWGSDTWMAWRRDWAQKVRTATTAEPVAQAILELVSQLQPRALTPSWALQLQPRFTRAFLRNGLAPSSSFQKGPSTGPVDHKAPARQKSGVKPVKAVTKAASKPGRLNRSSSAAADAPSAGRRRNYKEESDSGPSESDEEEAQDPFAADDLDDPTIVDSTGQVNRAGWALNHSRWEGDLQGRPKLPRELAKQLGRRGGTVRVVGVKYNTKQLVLQPKLAWKGAMQAVMTAPELALQLRKLDSNIQWEALKRPLGEEFSYASAEILGRRPAVTSTDAAAAAGRPPASLATAANSAVAAAASPAAVAAATGTSSTASSTASSRTGWEYLLQLSHGEALPDGINAAQRFPLQPLSQPLGQLHQPAGPSQQPQAPSSALHMPSSSEPTQNSQLNGMHSGLHSEQQQQQMSVLPNDAVVQQHQQAAGSPVDKQIAVQQAVSMASLQELPKQAQLASQTANGIPPGESPAGPTPDDTAGPSSADADVFKSAPSNSAQHAQHEAQILAAPSLPFRSLQPILAFQQSPIPFLSAANGAPKASTLLASLVPAVQQRPLSAGAVSVTAPGYFGSALPHGFVNSPGLSSREGTPTVKPSPTWINGDKLPLWLVKAFEEKRRRDVSMVAARAAQQAQRDANAANRASASAVSNYTPSFSLKTKRQEAKAAAEAAAAAAADACAVCGLLYGDDAVKDDFWIACDKCNRWYHGACVELTQETAEALEEAKWECPECSSMKNERRRIAVDRARQRRATQGKALIRVPSESDPGSEDILGATRKEAKKGRRPAAASKKSKKRKATEDPETVTTNEEEAEPAEAQELYCLCRQPDNPTRDFIECTDCAQWFHPECVGTSVEEVEASDKYTCPLCTRALQKEERKRQRQAEAAAAAELEREAREAQAARKAKLAELDMSDWPRNWQAAVQRVLENVLKLSEALPFAEPVPVEEVPGYQELVPNPMDLGTVLWRSKASSYDTPLEALADVRQVWANCRIYNAEGSQIWQVCADAESAFDQAWASARLPLPPAPPLPSQPSASKRQLHSRTDPGSSSDQQPIKGPKVKIKLTVKPSSKQQAEKEEEQSEESASGAEISDSDEPDSPQASKKHTRGAKGKQVSEQTEHAHLKLAQKVVKGLTKLDSAAPFLTPVSEEAAPGYHSVVKESMDLGTVLNKLKIGAYSSLGSILRDVDLVWANCRAFNEPDSDICALADEAQQALRIRWQQAGLPTVTPTGPPHPPSAKKNKGRKRTLEEALPADSDQPDDKAGDESAPKKKKQKGREQEKGTQAESSSAEELKRALKAVKGVLKLKVATLFSAPVSEEDVPGYHDVVMEPMDLQTVSDKLQQQQYTSIGEVYDDVELVWANCRAFNEPDSDICAWADEAQQAFKIKWQQQDLPDQDARPARKKSKGKAGKQQPGDTGKGGKAKQEGAAAADDKGNKKRQRKGGSEPDADAQPPESAQQSRKDRSNRDCTAAQTGRKAKQASAAADADASDSPDKDHQPNSSAAAKSPDKGKGKQKASKSNPAATESSAQPERKKRRISGAEEAEGDGRKQKKSQGAVKQEEQPTGTSEKSGGKKLTASERLRQGLPPTPGSRASARRGDAQISPEPKPEDQRHSNSSDIAPGPAQNDKTGRSNKRNSVAAAGASHLDANEEDEAARDDGTGLEKTSGSKAQRGGKTRGSPNGSVNVVEPPIRKGSSRTRSSAVGM